MKKEYLSKTYKCKLIQNLMKKINQYSTFGYQVPHHPIYFDREFDFKNLYITYIGEGSIVSPNQVAVQTHLNLNLGKINESFFVVSFLADKTWFNQFIPRVTKSLEKVEEIKKEIETILPREEDSNAYKRHSNLILSSEEAEKTHKLLVALVTKYLSED